MAATVLLAAQRGQPDADRGPPAARPRAADVVPAVARRGDVAGRAWAAAVAACSRRASCCRPTSPTPTRRSPSPWRRPSRSSCGIAGPLDALAGSRLVAARRRRRCAGCSRCGTSSPAPATSARVLEPERRLGTIGRGVAGAAHPRRVGVRPAVRRAGLDGRPAARAGRGRRLPVAVVALIVLGALLVRRRRRCGRRHRGARGDGGGRARGRWRRRRTPSSRSRRPSSSASSPRTTTGCGRSASFAAHGDRRRARCAVRRRRAAAAPGRAWSPLARSAARARRRRRPRCRCCARRTSCPRPTTSGRSAGQVARPLMDQLGDSLDAIDFTGPVLVDLGAGAPRPLHAAHRAAAARHRLPVRARQHRPVPLRARALRRRHRPGTCLTLRGGPDAVQLRSADTLLARCRASPTEQAAGRPSWPSGSATPCATASSVDDDAVDALGGDVPALLDQVRTTAGHAGAAPRRRSSTTGGASAPSTSPPELGAAVRRVGALERRADDDRMAIYLRPISSARPNLLRRARPRRRVPRPLTGIGDASALAAQRVLGLHRKTRTARDRGVASS